MLVVLHLGKSTAFGDLGVECIQPSLDVSDKLCLLSSCISSVQVSGGIYNGSVHTFDSSGTMLNGGSLASHCSQHLGRYSLMLSVIKNLIVDVSVGHVLKALSYLHLTL